MQARYTGTVACFEVFEACHDAVQSPALALSILLRSVAATESLASLSMVPAQVHWTSAGAEESK